LIADVSRRWVLAATAAGVAQLALPRNSLAAAATSLTGMRPGDFAWFPEGAAQGPVVIIASIPRQLVHVYRSGALIGVATCSTGKPGNSTPAGLFTVLNKYKDHHSSKYGDPMPNTLRLTRKGVALHGGELPGYPASHGCVRLPLDFADRLFELTPLGTPVVIGGLANHPLVNDSRIVPAGNAGKVLAAREAARSVAPAGGHADTAILVSAADRRVYVVQDGTVIAQGSATIDDAEEPLGTNVFVWRGGDERGSGSIWKGGSFKPVPGAAVVDDAAVLERLDASSKIMGTIEKVMHPGVVLLTTDQPLYPQRVAPRRRRRTVHRKRTRKRYSRRSR
jgi:hypothetical protein